MVLQVIENDLAGGFGGSVVHEERIDIDQRQAPFTANLNVPTGSDGTLEQPQIVAYIEDWAGRKTFVRSQPVSIPNDGKVYTRLDAILTGQEALPAGAENFITSKKLTGTAEFEAFKGLPAGAVLTVSLRDELTYSKVLQSTSVTLDGLSGYVDFAMDVEAQVPGNAGSVPIITAQITSAQGEILFITPMSLERRFDTNVIRLTPTPAY